MALTWEQRSAYACDVCGNVPDKYGVIEHGRGCYVVDEDGGGVSCVEFDEEEETPMANDTRKRLIDDAKQCESPMAAALLICVANWLDGRETFENQRTLHEEFDRVMRQLVGDEGE